MNDISSVPKQFKYLLLLEIIMITIIYLIEMWYNYVSQE